MIKNIESFMSNNMPNILYTIITAVFFPIIAYLVKVIINLKSEKGWLIPSKEKGGYFFGWIMCYSILASIVISFIQIFIKSILAIYTTTIIMNQILLNVITILLFLVSCRIILKYKRVRIRLLKRKRKSILIIVMPLFVLTSLLSIHDNDKNALLYIILYILLIVSEIIGLLYFSESYTVFEFSYANLSISDGSYYQNIRMDKIKSKNIWITIESENKKIYIRNKNITKVEYHGEKMITLNKFSDMLPKNKTSKTHVPPTPL